MQHLQNARLAHVCIICEVLVSPSRITLGFFFMDIIFEIQMQQSRENRGCLSWFCYKTWYPFKTLRSVLILAVILGVIFIGLAILQVALYSKTHQYQVLYANNQDCIERTNGSDCENILEIKEDMEPPIAFVYVLQNAYINHRKYIDSVSPDQLAGKTVDFNKASKECTPFVTNANMGTNHSYTGAPLDSSFVASPCGFSAKLSFNDTFKLYNQAGTQIPINESGLFPNIYGQFKRPSDSESTQWKDPEGDHFMLWMKNSGAITKYKLWGRIEETLPAGKYNLVSSNNFKIGDMRIKKGVLVVNPSALGSTVYFFPIVFAVMGLMCFAFTIFMKVKLPDYDALLADFEKKQK